MRENLFYGGLTNILGSSIFNLLVEYTRLNNKKMNPMRSPVGDDASFARKGMETPFKSAQGCLLPQLYALQGEVKV